MIGVTKRADCCGCTACFNICPQMAIAMQSDDEGFLYPDVNENICTNCGRCKKVCPAINPKINVEETSGCIIRYNDAEIVEESTSGGAFTAFASYLISKGAVIYGAGYDDNMQVICKSAAKESDLKEMRGSKFVQSRLDDVFSKIKKQLQIGTTILFTGTPCQTAGLLNYLGGKPDNLICIDFVCRGVSSPLLWQNYMEMLQKKYQSKIIDAHFKNKTYGYHSTTMKIDFADGKILYASGRIDPMMKAFVNEMASRPSCAACKFKGIERPSDITMFDCYEFSEITGKSDDDKGYTSLLIHTDKGRKLLEDIADRLTVYPVDVHSLVTQNGIMVCSSAKPHPKRDEFYKLARQYPIDIAMNMVNPITTIDYLIEGTKGILFKTGLIKAARRLKRPESIEIAENK